MLLLFASLSLLLALTNKQALAQISLTYPQCPQLCSCTYSTSNQLTIACGTNAQNGIALPNSNQSPLQSTESIIVKNSNLATYPTNICSYAATLLSLDLSSNQINQNLPSTYLSCLTNLQYLYLYNNHIPSVDAGAFANNPNLITIDLSLNSIATLPVGLFTNSLSKLLTLKLNNNALTSLDAWFFSLPAIINIDLSNNLISTFTNNVGFSLLNAATLPQVLKNTTLIDLRYNMLTGFDDSVLRLFGACTSTTIKYLLQLLYPMHIDLNNLACVCVNSYNLLTNVEPLISSGALDISRNLFTAKCVSGASIGASIFNFESPTAADCANGVAFSSSNCPSSSTSTNTPSTSTSTNNNNNINGAGALIAAPNVPLALQSQPSLYNPQIAGIILGLLGFLILFFILLYCICPIEILSLLFACIPYFYKMCPCKSGVRRDKEYDLFISYNRSNTSWVKNKLIPFIQEKCLVENYILHYNSDNKEHEVFGAYIKEIMDRSSCILLVLSDAFLMNEWNNRDFQLHLRHLITRERTRFVCVQLHDVCDEEVDEYFVDKLQIPRFVSLEDDEFLFWTKLAYHLYTNDADDKVMPVSTSPRHYAYLSERGSPDDYTKTRPNDHIDFDSYNLPYRPIIHLPSQRDPESKNRPAVRKQTGRRMLETFRTTFMGSPRANTKLKNKTLLQSEQFVDAGVQQQSAGRILTSSNSRRPSKVEANLDERWNIVDNEEYGITNVTFSNMYDEGYATSKPRIEGSKAARKSAAATKLNGYSIKKTGNNLHITMPVAHDVYLSHQVQNKKVSMLSPLPPDDHDDSNESNI